MRKLAGHNIQGLSWEQQPATAIARHDTREWILNFLSGRSQRVVLEGASSDSEPVVSGVPQGTVLGPVLFLLYINDLPDVAVHSTARLFADDCIVYRPIRNNDDTILLQNDLNKIAEWEFIWQMQFIIILINALF